MDRWLTISRFDPKRLLKERCVRIGGVQWQHHRPVWTLGNRIDLGVTYSFTLRGFQHKGSLVMYHKNKMEILNFFFLNQLKLPIKHHQARVDRHHYYLLLLLFTSWPVYPAVDYGGRVQTNKAVRQQKGCWRIISSGTFQLSVVITQHSAAPPTSCADRMRAE